MKRLCEGRVNNDGASKYRKIEGNSVDNKEVISDNAQAPRVLLYDDIFTAIFQYSVEGYEESQKFLHLLRLSEVCKAFNIQAKHIVAQKINAYELNLYFAMLFGGDLLEAGKWTVPAVYYTFAYNFLKTSIDKENTSNTQNLTETCCEILKKFKESLLTSNPTIKKTGNDFIVQSNRAIQVRFNQESNVSINALNILISENYLLRENVFDLCLEHETLISLMNFLKRHNSEKDFSLAFEKHIDFLCKKIAKKPMESVLLLNCYIKKDLIDRAIAFKLMNVVFPILSNSVESHIFPLIGMLVKKKLIGFDNSSINFLKHCIFTVYEKTIQDKDSALFLFQELTAANYLINLNPNELSLLKDHAIQRLVFYDIDFTTNVLETLTFLTKIESIDLSDQSARALFQPLRKAFITKVSEYDVSEKVRFIRVFKLFSQHPQNQINSYAKELCIVLEEGIESLKSHAFSILFSDQSDLIQKDYMIQILIEIVSSNHQVALDALQLEHLKAYATVKFSESSPNLLFLQNLIELLSNFVIDAQELFPIVKLNFFKGVHSFITSSKLKYTPKVAEQLSRIYDPFQAHPDEQIANLSKEICLVIKDGVAL